MEHFLVSNKLQCLNCNDIIESTYRHDYVKCDCGGCTTDGGLDYLHRSWHDDVESVDLSTYSNAPHWALRHEAFRLGYGKTGAADYGIFRKTLIKDMTDAHLQALLNYCQPSNRFLPIYNAEIEYRKQHNIKIDET
jgi:hypothetical protein